MAQIKFFSLKSKKSVLVDVSKCTLKTLKNGRKAAEAMDPKPAENFINFSQKKTSSYRITQIARIINNKNHPLQVDDLI